MATVNITFRVDSELKKEAEELFEDFGLNMNNAFVMFLKQSVRDQQIPFVLSRKKRKAKKSLEERFEGYTGDYKCTEYDWGEPVGKEVW